MRVLFLGFITGISLLLSPPALQPHMTMHMAWFGLGIACIALIILNLVYTQNWLQQHAALKIILLVFTGLGSFSFGLGYGQAQISQNLQQRLKQPTERTTVVRVIGISEGIDHRWRQVVEELKPQTSITSQRWLLYSHFDWEQGQKATPPAMQAGQLWQVHVKLKPIHGYASFGAFDSEKWLLQQHIQATGTVQTAQQLTHSEIQKMGLPSPLFISEFLSSVEQIRFEIRQHFLQFDSPARGVLLGLLTGDRSLISPETTRLYQQMGISHLLAISGPHVLLAALVICWLWQQLLNRFTPFYLLMERPRWILPVFLLVVVAYALLAGFDIPAQRTVVMVAIIASVQWWRKSWRIETILLLTASSLLLFDPLAILSVAFWLSFGAVAILLALSRLSVSHMSAHNSSKNQLSANAISWQAKAAQHIQQFIVLQWRIFVLLSPLVIWCFAKLSWLSPIVNLMAIPLLGMLIVPLNLLAFVLYAISTTAADGVWGLSLVVLEGFHGGLQQLAQVFPHALQPFYLTPLQFLALWGCLLLLLLPQGILPRWWLAFLLLPLGYPKSQSAPLTMHVLDVGQGLSILITTPKHAMLVDTGAKTPNFDLGEQVVLPALYAQGIKRLDKLMLTHLDNDHSGGAQSIINQMPVTQLTSSETYSKYPTYHCESGQQWVWDGVVFKILSPIDIKQQQMSANENSCVLLVETPAMHGIPAQRILIMGDAGFYTEFLLQQYMIDIKADILVLGHHGSKHSSSSSFLQAVQPQRVVVSAGYLNRYGHPDPFVVARLEEQGIIMDSTIDAGTLSYSLGETKVIEPKYYRQQKLWLQH